MDADGKRRGTRAVRSTRTGSDTAAGDEIGDQILRSLRRILRRVSEHSRFLARSGGLTVPQFLCLRAISASEHGRLSIVQLAETVQLAPATVSRIVDRLERAGHVVRERCSDDRRKVFLTVTDAGAERLASLPTPLHERFVERLAALTPRRRAAIRAVLDELVSMLEAEDLDAAPVLMPGVDAREGASDVDAFESHEPDATRPPHEGG